MSVDKVKTNIQLQKINEIFSSNQNCVNFTTKCRYKKNHIYVFQISTVHIFSMFLFFFFKLLTWQVYLFEKLDQLC